MILLAGTTIAGHNPESALYLSGKLACYNLYRTSDDRYLALALLEPKFWENFCAKLNLSHLAGLQFQENQTELIKTLSEKLAAAPLHHWLEYFREEDVCITPVQNIQEALDSEYVKAPPSFHVCKTPVRFRSPDENSFCRGEVAFEALRG